MPKGKDYLSVYVSTLNNIYKTHGDSQSTPFKLTRGIYWHKAHLIFEKCNYSTRVSQCDRVQVLLPLTFTPKKRPEPFSKPRGAVIFGRSARFPWMYPKHGVPIEEIGAKDGNTEGIFQTGSQPLNSGVLREYIRGRTQGHDLIVALVSSPTILAPRTGADPNSELSDSGLGFSTQTSSRKTASSIQNSTSDITGLSHQLPGSSSSRVKDPRVDTSIASASRQGEESRESKRRSFKPGSWFLNLGKRMGRTNN